jgi:aryl-alcohol dehydrogenase-like predicted oxidoreductase/DNA-binding CsgD family transcriptional regulator
VGNRLANPTAPPTSGMGLGLMSLSDVKPGDGTECIATIRAALDADVSLFETADFYGMGYNELLLRDALRGHPRDRVQINIKFGVLRDPDGGFHGVDTRPEAVKTSIGYTLRRIGTDYIDTYRPAGLSPGVPVEETVGAIADLVTAGYVRHVGLSQVDQATLRRAAAVHPIGDMQIGYSLVSHGFEAQLLQTARELGVGITALALLFSGPPEVSAHTTGPAPRDASLRAPGEAGSTPEQNRELAATLHAIAAEAGATPPQIAIAWAMAHGPDIIPLVDVRHRDRLAEALGALRLRISQPQLARIDAAATRVPPIRPAGPEPIQHGRQRGPTPLTRREKEVLDLVVAGLTNRGIAKWLGISERTAREHVARILLKLQVRSRVEAAVIATQWRLAR